MKNLKYFNMIIYFMVCVRALVRITSIQVQNSQADEDPGSNAEWRLTISADG